MVKFKATDEQIKHLHATAANASNPVGLGYLHFQAGKKFTAADFSDAVLHYGTDYVQGRMVKCYPHRLGEGVYELEEPRPDYQSWALSYPTAKDLIAAAGLEVVE